MSSDKVIGWDIGGAHIKLACATSANNIEYVEQIACPLWKGIDELDQAIASINNKYDLQAAKHSITMTGELVDCFADRKQGVIKVSQQMQNLLGDAKAVFFAGQQGMIAKSSVEQMYAEIASANWLASAKYTANKIDNALFVDIGSTTTDIVNIKDAEVVFEGFSDEDRLYAQELVYCGVVRTPVFALCKTAPIKNRFIPVINEYFANAADVYRLSNELPLHADMSDTADGEGKDTIASARRLARMFANDINKDDIEAWQTVANYVREQQIQLILNACRVKLTKVLPALDAPVIGAGVGRFLSKELAKRLNRPYIDFASLLNTNLDNEHKGVDIGDCAPACAVACLGYQEYHA